MSNRSNLDRPRFLEGDRIFLTPLAMEDLEKNLTWDNDSEMSLLDGGSHRPKTREVAVKEFEETLANPKSLFFTRQRLAPNHNVESATVDFGADI